MLMKKKPNQITELKHYIRANMKTDEREIIVEQVQAGSASFKFLKRMEEGRKYQECVRTIDMRGKVPYECKSYVHKNQVFWMDDISYNIYKKGMTENNEVLTNKVFESIIQGEHTLHKQKNTHQVSLPEKISNIDNQVIEDSFDSEKFMIEGEDADIHYLGYYQKRKETRLKQTTEISITLNNRSFSAKTKDISAGGLKVFFQKPVMIEIGDVINVTFTGFNKTYDAKLINIKYKILNMDYKEPDFLLNTVCVDSDNNASKFIKKFIDDQQKNIRGRKKLDIEDIKLTSDSLLTELFYTYTTPSVPFFINRNNNNDMELSTICVNAVSKETIKCFKNNNDIYDFTNFSDKSRISTLVNYTQNDGQKDPILAVFANDAGSPRILFNYDFPDTEHWNGFVRDKLKTNNIRLFKVIVRSMEKPDKRKIAYKIEKFISKAKEVIDDLMEFSENIVKAGVLVDVTSEVSDLINHSNIGKNVLNKINEITSKYSALAGNDVEILQFGYKEQRREDRYHVSVDAEVVIDEKKYSGSTSDISIKGLCLELDISDDIAYRKGDVVKVSFPLLHKRASERINLIAIPYTITCAHMDKGKPILHMKREKTKSWNDQSAFFKDLIDRNIKLIKLDTKDIETAAKSKLIGSVAVENTATIPFFVEKGNIAGGSKTTSIGLPPKSTSFTEFFEVAPDLYNFKSITHANRISKLISKAKNRNISELIIYLYKVKIEGIAKYEIYSATNDDFESPIEKYDFLTECQKHDYRVIKLSVSNVQEPDATEINSSIESLQDVSPNYAQRQLRRFNSIVTVGDVIDVTSQMIVSASSEEVD